MRGEAGEANYMSAIFLSISDTSLTGAIDFSVIETTVFQSDLATSSSINGRTTSRSSMLVSSEDPDDFGTG